MKRYQHYFKHRVTHTELNAEFDAVEDAQQQILVDQGFVGMIQGGGVGEHTPTPNLTVDIDGAAAGYDADGQRVAWAAMQTVNVAVDENAVSTAVATPGNEKWCSVFVAFARVLSDPRIDGNSDPLSYERAEGVTFTVVQGTEAGAGLAARPNLVAGRLLLCDILRTNGQTQILDADIEVDRRADQVVIAGTPLAIRGGTFAEALGEMLDTLNAHITALGFGHEATAVSYAGGGAWADGVTNPAASVEAQLDKVITDLAGTDGAEKIGKGVLPAWKDASEIDAGTLGENVDAIVSDLAGVSGDLKIGSPARAGSPVSLAAGSVGSQLAELQAVLNVHVEASFTATNTWLCPAGITRVRLDGVGGGGAGGGGAAADSSGGGGGAYASSQVVTVVPGTTYTITIPAAAVGGPAGSNGADGGDVTFAAPGPTVLARFKGGQGGAAFVNGGLGGGPIRGMTRVAGYAHPGQGGAGGVGTSAGFVHATGPNAGGAVGTGGVDSNGGGGGASGWEGGTGGAGGGASTAGGPGALGGGGGGGCDSGAGGNGGTGALKLYPILA